MSEAERLSEALGKIVEETDDAVTKPREWMKEKFVAIYSIATEALASKPDVCVYRLERSEVMTQCNRPIPFIVRDKLFLAVHSFESPLLCPGCGAQIEVKE